MNSPTVPSELLEAIGKVTFNFAALEYTLKLFIGVLLAPDDQQVSHCVTADLSFSGLVSLASALHRVRESNAPKREAVDNLLARASAVEQKRNAITHSNWGPAEGTADWVRIKSTARKRSQGLTWNFERLKISDINDIGREIGLVAADLQALLGHRAS